MPSKVAKNSNLTLVFVTTFSIMSTMP